MYEGNKSETNIKELDKYRKKRKKKQLIKRLTAVIILVIITLAAYFATDRFNFNGVGVVEYIRNFTADTTGPGWPLKLTGEKSLQMNGMGSTIALLTNQNVYLYNENAKKLSTITHGYLNPCMETSSKRVLIYDKGGNKFRIDNKTGSVYSKELLNKIVFGVINEKGYTAIITESDTHTNELTVYDQAGVEQYKWYSAENHIITAELSAGGPECTVAALGAENGVVKSSIIKLDGGDKEKSIAVLADTLVLSIKNKSGGRYGVICDNSSFIIDNNGEVTFKNEYSEDIVFIKNNYPPNALLVFENELNGDNIVIFLDNEKGVKKNITIEDKIIDAIYSNDRITILLENKIIIYNLEFEIIKEIESSFGFSGIKEINGILYEFGTAEIKKVS